MSDDVIKKISDLKKLLDYIDEHIELSKGDRHLIQRIKARCPDKIKQNDIDFLCGLILKLIPKGVYCYSLTDKEISLIPQRELCPFWDCDDEKDEQECGYCHLLQCGDWLNNDEKLYIDVKTGKKNTANEIGLPLSLLWDLCKECGLNDDFDE